MHQMRISTHNVSSVLLRPKNLEIGNDMTVETRKKTQTECREVVDWLFTVLIPAQEFFTYMETLPLPVKGYKI
jgi:hypothetical protein